MAAAVLRIWESLFIMSSRFFPLTGWREAKLALDVVSPS
jgi:hypothetical protein